MSDDGKDADAGSQEHQEDAEDVAKRVESSCWAAFQEIDRNNTGQVNSEEVNEIIDKMKLKMSQDERFKLVADIDPDNQGVIEYSDLKQRLVAREVERLDGSDDTELLDAFVAMGGQPDGEGCVDADLLIHIIKNDFGMTIDIEALIKEVDEDGSGEIEFDEFKSLL